MSNFNDPLLSSWNYSSSSSNIADLEAQLAILKQAEKHRVSVQVDMPMQHQSMQSTIWDDITDELSSLSDTQKEILFKDSEYQQRDSQIAQIAAKYQMSLLMPYVLSDKEGKKALESQLYTIRAKKDHIIQQEAKEQEEFRKWKESQTSGTKKSKDEPK